MHTQTHLDIARNIAQGLDGLVRDALDATGLARHSLRDAEALLAAAPSHERTVPFSSVSTWMGSCTVQARLLMVLLQARHFSRATALYLAHPLEPGARSAFQSVRATARNLLRFVEAARRRLRLHVSMLRDLRAARADIRNGATLLSQRTTFAAVFAPATLSYLGNSIHDAQTAQRMDGFLCEAMVCLTGQPN
jgi:hypothetical protein